MGMRLPDKCDNKCDWLSKEEVYTLCAWKQDQGGTFSRNFSLTMSMMDMTCSKLLVDELKFGQR